MPRHWYPYDISICRYPEIMSLICIDLTAKGRRKNRLTNKSTLPTSVALPLLTELYPVVSRGLTITPYYVRHWSCHGIVDPPLLFFALVSNDQSCLAVARRLLRRGARGGEKRTPWRETAVFWPREPGVRLRSLFKPHYNTSEEWRARARREKLVQQTEVSNVSSRLAPSYDTAGLRRRRRLARFTPLPSPLPSPPPSFPVFQARCPRWMLPKVVLIGEELDRLWLVRAAAVDPSSETDFASTYVHTYTFIHTYPG